MKLISNDFAHQGNIPSLCTCDGQDRNPHLSWSQFPQGTRSFALTCLDPDAPRGTFSHWFIVDIPPTTTATEQGMGAPKHSRQIQNDFGKESYGGPCPPKGTHRYFFTVYALNVDRLQGVTAQNVLQRIGAHAIDKAILMGNYVRSKS